jgi:hypothetical protein
MKHRRVLSSGRLARVHSGRRSSRGPAGLINELRESLADDLVDDPDNRRHDLAQRVSRVRTM